MEEMVHKKDKLAKADSPAEPDQQAPLPDPCVPGHSTLGTSETGSKDLKPSGTLHPARPDTGPASLLPQPALQSPSLLPPHSPGLLGDRAAPARNSCTSSVGFPSHLATSLAQPAHLTSCPATSPGRPPSAQQADAWRHEPPGAGSPPDAPPATSPQRDASHLAAEPATPRSRTGIEGRGSGAAPSGAPHTRRCTGVFADADSPGFQVEDLDAIFALELAETQSRSAAPAELQGFEPSQGLSQALAGQGAGESGAMSGDCRRGSGHVGGCTLGVMPESSACVDGTLQQDKPSSDSADAPARSRRRSQVSVTCSSLWP